MRESQPTASPTPMSLAGQHVTLCSPRAFVQRIDAGRYSTSGVTSHLTKSRSLITTLAPWTDAWRTDYHTVAGGSAIADCTYLSEVFADLTREMKARQIETGLLSKTKKFRGGSNRSLVHKLRQAIVAAHQVDDGSSRPERYTITEPGKVPKKLIFPLEEADDDPLHDDEPQPLEWVVQILPIPVDFTRLEIPPGAETFRIDLDWDNHPTIVATEERSSVERVGGRLDSSHLPQVFGDFSDETEGDGSNYDGGSSEAETSNR